MYINKSGVWHTIINWVQVIISYASWWLCAMKAASSANMGSCARRFLIFFTGLNETGIEQVYFWSTLYPFSLGGISECFRQHHRKKNQEMYEGKVTALSIYSQP